jgi:hypothetical protein
VGIWMDKKGSGARARIRKIYQRGGENDILMDA